MVTVANLGFPRIGAQRELKFATEEHWAGQRDEASLVETGRQLRLSHWQLQKQLGVDWIPVNDFSFYDHVLDQAAVVGAIPPRFDPLGQEFTLKKYFAMARGYQERSTDGTQVLVDIPAMEMTKWFDTNYHYIVPEFYRGQKFSLTWNKPLVELREAGQENLPARPVLLGPISFLYLGKSRQEDFDRFSLLPELLPVYAQLLKELQQAGASWIQIDEPCLVLDLDQKILDLFPTTYAQLAAATSARLLLTTYFGDLRENLALVTQLPVAGVHLDLVRAPQQLDYVFKNWPSGMTLSMGIVDGRNVWRTDLEAALEKIEKAVERLGPEHVQLAPSCSLIHVPVDLDLETDMDPEIRQWLAFAKQKLQELKILARAVNEGRQAVQAELEQSRAVQRSRKTSPRIHNQAVQRKLAEITPEMTRRAAPYPERRKAQRQHLNLPLLPTTTIGSFPQTREVRQIRARYRRGQLPWEEYKAFIQNEIKKCIEIQEEIGLDVLVHGEFERNDMVEYFGEQLDGFVFTKHAWVQSYGSRYVKPPIIYGDVSRPGPMTIDWITYAQSLTQKPVKGMLTGPVTILQWSFVRDDQPREVTCRQIALAIRDEVQDLEKAGIRVIQIDEPALREGLPLRRDEWASYLKWAVECFRLASSCVRNETQIHTHMCYSEFNDIIEAIAEMDADVISIESSRSQMELLDVFKQFKYPNEIGPGVYDIHSPRIPTKEEIEALLRKALQVLSPEQLWVNPDCGLKTRRWEEVIPSLRNMVQAAQTIRAEISTVKV